MARNIRWDESALDNALILVEALLQLCEQRSPNLQPKPQLYVYWDGDKLRVTGYETKQTPAKISRTDEVGTKKEHLLKRVKTVGKSLKLSQRRTEFGSNQQEKELQEVQYVLDILRELELLVEDVKNTRKNRGYWKFTLTLKHQTATTQENLDVVKQKWNEHRKTNSAANSQATSGIDNSINWRQICTAMLESQQAAARLRRQATEKGFELNVYVPLGLVERKQQQRRQQDEQRERENVYELTQEVIVKTYEHDAFLNQVIAQQPTGNNKKLHSQGDGVLGHGEWGMGHGFDSPMPNAQCPKSAGGLSSPLTRGWSFPPTSNKHIAIIGEPGAGKTTLLSTIATYIKDQTQDLFICISLANLQGRTIEEYLLQRWLPEALRLVKSDFIVTPAKIERQLIECFGKLRVWLLLDGVDEMGENSPVQALAKINQQLTESLRQARVVLTCRLNVWDAQVKNTLSGFDTYKTQEFKPEQIDDFIQQWFTCAKNCQKGETLQAKLKADRHENIRKLVTNPLRLALLCQTFDLDIQGELPETKAALYERFTRYFYYWKSELFPELSDSDNLKDELHSALSKLAFAGINSSSKFRLRRRLARQEMGEELFKLARDVGWLNLVDRLAKTDEEVYAFFHPNFQEYFAALAVNDWHEFINHIPDNPKQGTYRIFAPQWKEVILLWLGREDVRNEEKEAFIQALVEFNDGCGEWNREDIDKGFYDYRAYFLAAVSIVEFKHCCRTDEIVKQIVKWRFGYFNTNQQKWVKFLYVIVNEANTALQQTERTKAIAALVQLLQSQDVDDDTRRQAAYSLGKIDPGNENEIAALVQLLQSQDVGDLTRWLAAYSLGEIDPGNEFAIPALKQLLQSQDVDDDTRRRAAESLGKIDPGNEFAIAALVQLLQSQDVDDYTRRQAAYSLGKIDPGNEFAIAALVQLLQSQDVDDDTRWQAAESLEEIGTGNVAALVQLLQSQDVDNFTRKLAAQSLGKIDPGNENAIAALVQLLQSQDVDDETRCLAAQSLGEIGTGNEKAIAALVQLLQSQDVDDFTRWQAAYSLGEIGTGNEFAIAALVQLLQSQDVDDYTRRLAAYSLGIIGTGNEFAIAALVQLLQSQDVDEDTRRLAAESLGKIGTGYEFAIAALVQLLQSQGVGDYTRRQAAESLGKIGTGNEFAIATLVQLLQSPYVDNYTRRQAAVSLGKILQSNKQRFLAIKALKGYLQFDDNYNVIWECAQNMPYPDFYNAWHDG